MRLGTRVEVRSTFEGTWVSGYELVDERADGSVVVRRLSDGEVLPAFPADAVRRERRRETWWL